MVAFFDLDNTLYDGYSLFDFIEFLCQKKYFNSNLCERYRKLVAPYLEGRGDRLVISGQILELFVQNLQGKPAVEIAEKAQEFWRLHCQNLISPVVKEFQRLKKAGYEIVIITGSPDVLEKPFCQTHQVILGRAAEMKVVDGKFTGEITHNSSAESKGAAAKEYLQKRKLNLVGSYGFGDEPGDFGFLELVENAYVVEERQRLKPLHPPPR